MVMAEVLEEVDAVYSCTLRSTYIPRELDYPRTGKMGRVLSELLVPEPEPKAPKYEKRFPWGREVYTCTHYHRRCRKIFVQVSIRRQWHLGPCSILALNERGFHGRIVSKAIDVWYQVMSLREVTLTVD